MTGIFELYRITASSSGAPEYPIVPAMSGIPESYGDWYNANGLYKIYDASQTGTNRIWKHETEEFYIRYVYGQWALVRSTSDTSYSLYISNYSGSYSAPYDEKTGESYTWTYQGSANSSIAFELETYGNTNFFLKDPSDESMMYDGVYVKQTKKGIDYMIPCSDGQLWIQNPSFELNEANKSTRCALWCDGTNYMIGTVQVDSSGNVTEKTPKYTVAGNGTWPWKMIDQFGDGSLSIKKTQDSTLIIPQGVEVTEGNYYDSLIAKYPYRYISGNAFPVEGDTFYEHDKGGRNFVCYKDSYTNTLKWGIRTNGSSSDSYSADATWFWPDKAKFSMSYGGSGAVVNAISTGETNIRIIQTSLDTPTDFTDFGVYKRLTGFTNQSYNITFDYSSTAIAADQINGQNITSHAKVWIKAADYEAFMNSEPMGDTEYRAIVMLSPGRSNIAVLPEIENTNDTIYEPNFYCFGTVTKGVGTTYLSITSIKGFCYAPAMFWPWELDASFYSGITIFRSELDHEPLPAPYALLISGTSLRCDGYYGNRQLVREDIPSNGDHWKEGPYTTSNTTQIYYNDTNKRWEGYRGTSNSDSFIHSSNTTERWPDDPDLIWYYGNKGPTVDDSLIENYTIIATDEDLVEDRVVVTRCWSNTSYHDHGNGEYWPVLNKAINVDNAPSITDGFVQFKAAKKHLIGIEKIDSLYHWKLYFQRGDEGAELLEAAYTYNGAATLEELGWPWDRYDWVAYDRGGMGLGNRGISAPAFAVKGTDITQNYGTFHGICTATYSCIPELDGVFVTNSSSIEDEHPQLYTKFIRGDWQFSICYTPGYPNEVSWLASKPNFYNQDEYSSYDCPYASEFFSLNDLKWPWEVMWTTTTSWYSPPPIINKYGGTVRGMYWGDQLTIQNTDDSSKRILEFNCGTTVPSTVNVRYGYDFTTEKDGTVYSKLIEPWSGIFANKPEFLLFENFHEYDVIYYSNKTDKRTYGYDDSTGQYLEIGYDEARGILAGKYNAELDTFEWELFGVESLQYNPVSKVYPTYKATGRYPFNLTWTNADGEPVTDQYVSITENEFSNDSNSTAPGLVPKTKYQWKSSDDTASVAWNSTEKRYELSLDGQTYNSIAFNEETPSLFPWELTAKQWNNIPYEMGIRGSRFLLQDTNIKTDSGSYAIYNADGMYYSTDFGGKFADQSIIGDNVRTHFIKRESSIEKFKSAKGTFSFIIENYGGPQWKLYAYFSSTSNFTRFCRQDRANWESNETYETMKPPYDLSVSFHARRDAKVGTIMPSFGHIIPNGQIDYETVEYFGVRFSVSMKKDGGAEYTVPFVYSSPNIGFNGYPVEGQTWTGTYESDTYKWQWNTEEQYWELLVNGVVQVRTTVRTGDQPDLFPWEYRAYEYSTWTKTLNGSGYVIQSTSTSGSRFVITGAGENSYNDPINGSYVSYYIDPSDYSTSSSYRLYRWINEKGGSFGRFNTSGRWQFTGIGDQIYAVDRNKLPWVDEDFTTNSSYSLKPSNFLLNGRPQENTTGFASMYEVYGSESELNGSYVLVGYTYASEDVFDILTYRNPSTGALLRRENSTWTLSLNGVVKYQASDATLHYPQDTTVVWEATASGSADTTPYIIAVDAATKIPAVNNWNMTVADAGEASVNGTYTEDHSAGAYGIDRSWTSESSNVIKYADSAWGIYASDTLMYTVDATQLEDGTSSDPYGEEGVTLTWIAESGAEPVPSVTAEVVLDTITVSGASDSAINGEYNLVDTAAEGDDRIWTNGTYYIARGTSYTVWMLRNTSGRPSNPGSGGVYFYGSDTSKANPYNDDGTSYTWYSMYGSGTLSVIKN